MTAIILAGGFGSRLQNIVTNVPKPMAPINGKPFLEYILNYLSKYNFRKIILSVGYKKDIIIGYFGNKYRELEIFYAIENEPLGTGGAIKHALQYTEERNIYVINGDTFFKIDLNLLYKFFTATKTKIIIALKELFNFDRYGCVKLNSDNKITAFKEKGHYEKGFINGGIYIIDKMIFENYNVPKCFSFEKFVQENFISLNAMGIVYHDYFVDIGIPKDYGKAQVDLI